MITFISDALFVLYIFAFLWRQWVCQEFCVNRFNKQHRIAA